MLRRRAKEEEVDHPYHVSPADDLIKKEEVVYGRYGLTSLYRAVVVDIVTVNQGVLGEHRYGGGSFNRKVIFSVRVELSHPRERIFVLGFRCRNGVGKGRFGDWGKRDRLANR